MDRHLYIRSEGAKQRTSRQKKATDPSSPSSPLSSSSSPDEDETAGPPVVITDPSGRAEAVPTSLVDSSAARGQFAGEVEDTGSAVPSAMDVDDIVSEQITERREDDEDEETPEVSGQSPKGKGRGRGRGRGSKGKRRSPNKRGARRTPGSILFPFVVMNVFRPLYRRRHSSEARSP
jgi:hypothetical protein